MLIGQVARQSGVSIKTIRYYEDVGVPDPPRRTGGGYRDYDAEVVDRLAFVRAAQAAGFTLGEIRQVLALRARGEPPCAHVAALLEYRCADLDRRIAELQQAKAEVSKLARRARALDPRDCRPAQVCHVLGPVP